MEAYLEYRPASLSMLCGAVQLLRKKRLRERYVGDLIWKAAKGLWKDFSMVPFSEYDDLLEGKKRSAESENEAVRRRVEQMLNMFDQKTAPS